MTTCHAVLKKSEDKFVVVEVNDADFVVAEAVSTDTNWCRPIPVQKSEKSHCDEAESTYLDTDLQDPSTRSLSVDQHHLGVDRQSSSTEAESTFDEAESSELDTEESTPDSSVDRHSPSVDRHWTRTAPYALMFPPPSKKSDQERRDEECRLKLMITTGISDEDVSLLTKDISVILVYEDPEKKPNKRLSMAISELVSAMIQCSNPEKLLDPGSFVQDCSISTGQFPHSLCDLGSSINLMPHSVAVETSTNITVGYVKELDSIEQVNMQASKLEDWSGDHLFSTRIQDQAQIGDKLLQIAEPNCKNNAEFRAADSVSIDTTRVSIDTRLDEMDHCRPHHQFRSTQPPVLVDTQNRQNQSCPTKLFFGLESLL
ncbi:hypothetical protein ISN45_Aa03g034880 [Arabidopsis thaliana x Arabidopsis arenosa]|uniref:Uncharacterized protein n=1 Tax=Arabidopsis thaliana x Arabidopsis arenosa TaxID=1240361 RepID=A0A8T2B2T9_9BRAS|nr:hypothetical protein ISN45_Aa03g034880 [Arabidopsis thaliana x Arabidopsis arenosa]